MKQFLNVSDIGDLNQALQEARIKALQSQINPHFLNNTLESICVKPFRSSEVIAI